jgi:hypothetical protein
MRGREERRDSMIAADILLGAASEVLFAHVAVDDPEPIRPKGEDELSVMQVMIAQAQATIASANLLYVLAEERVR